MHALMKFIAKVELNAKRGKVFEAPLVCLRPASTMDALLHPLLLSNQDIMTLIKEVSSFMSRKRCHLVLLIVSIYPFSVATGYSRNRKPEQSRVDEDFQQTHPSQATEAATEKREQKYHYQRNFIR